MKKVLSFILVLSMVLGSFGMAFAAPVATSDIAGHKNEAAIQRLNKLGLVKGYEDGSFQPEKTITRAEFAVLLVRALGLESSAKLATGDTQFTDVTMTNGFDWATGAINVASRLGYINGYGDGKFGPADQIKYEDAITLIVRVLGYEPAAQDKGGYPVGYLVVAEQELDITDNTDAVAGLAATRGTVFQLLDNALTEPMMIQVGYGDDKKYVVSGTEDTDAKYLFDQLGFDRYEDRLLDFDVEDLEIYDFAGEDVLVVEEEFDFQAAFGLELIIWADGEEVITYELNETAVYDAVEVTETEEEIELIEAEKEYKLTDDTIVYVDGDFERTGAEALVEDDTYNYAKVVLDGKEVVFISLYNFDEFIVVEEVEDEVVFGYGQELDVEDYTIVKDGVTVNIDDLEKGDILFFNEGVEYAEVFNKSVDGEIKRIYEDTFEVGSDEFDYSNDIFGQVQYLDGEEIANFDDEVADKMKDAEEKVTVFVDRNGEAVYVVGDLGEGTTTSFYAFVTADVVEVDGRRETLWALDVITQDGEELQEDINEDDVDLLDADGNELTWNNDVLEVSDVVEIEIDEDGDIAEITLLDERAANVDFETDDKFVEGLKLGSNAVVFNVEEFTTDTDDIEVAKLSDVDFDEVLEGDVYANTKDEVIVIVVRESDKEADTTKYDAVVTKNPAKVSGEKTWRLELIVNGEKETYFTEKDAFNTFNYERGDFLNVELDDETNEIVGVTRVASNKYDGGTVTLLDNSNRNRVVEVNGTEYRLEDATIIDATDSYKIKNFRDIEDGDKVNLFLAAAGSKYVKYAVIVETTGQEVAEDDALIAAIEAAEVALDAHIAAGGLATDAEYVAVEAAIASEVTADIETTTAALEVATKALVDAATDAEAALAAAIEAAESAQAAYLAAGGLATDSVYTDVEAAVTSEVTADIETTTTALEAATKVLVDAAEAAKVAAAVADVNAATNIAEMRIALEENAELLGLDMTLYNELSDTNKNVVADDMLGADLTDETTIADAFRTAVRGRI